MSRQTPFLHLLAKTSNFIFKPRPSLHVWRDRSENAFNALFALSRLIFFAKKKNFFFVMKIFCLEKKQTRFFETFLEHQIPRKIVIIFFRDKIFSWQKKSFFFLTKKNNLLNANNALKAFSDRSRYKCREGRGLKIKFDVFASLWFTLSRIA